MDTMISIFGEGRNLTAYHMTARVVVVFIFALLLIRISGRRSFGIKSPLDNIIIILLGTILGRAVVGVSPFFPVLICSLVLVVLHRLIAALFARSPLLSQTLEGKKILLFENKTFLWKNLNRAMLSKEDIMQGLRLSALTEDTDEIEKIYIERNGKISIVKAKKTIPHATTGCKEPPPGH